MNYNPMPRIAGICIATTSLILTGCSTTLFDIPEDYVAVESQATTNNPTPKRLNDDEYGWIHAGCFASTNSKDLTGITVKVIDLQAGRVVHGRLGDRIDTALTQPLKSDDTCFPLSAERRALNLTEGRSFYTIETDSNVGLAIGVIGNTRFKYDVLQGYSYCEASDRFIFTAWEQAPYTSAKRWEGNYYVDYAMIPTCPRL